MDSPALKRRMDRVRVLLETRDEPYEALLSRPETGAANSGFAEPRKRHERCGGCGGRGCPRCTAGRVEVLERDAYDTGVDDRRFWGLARSAMRLRDIDSELSRLRADELRRAGYHQHERFGWERARAAQDRVGSYHELDRAMELLRQSLPDVSSDSEEGVRFLALALGERVRIPWAYEEIELDQLAAEVAAFPKSTSDREIAAALELWPRIVRRLRRRKPASKP